MGGGWVHECGTLTSPARLNTGVCRTPSCVTDGGQGSQSSLGSIAGRAAASEEDVACRCQCCDEAGRESAGRAGRRSRSGGVGRVRCRSRCGHNSGRRLQTGRVFCSQSHESAHRARMHQGICCCGGMTPRCTRPSPTATIAGPRLSL